MADTLPGTLFSAGEAEAPYCNLRDMVSPEARAGKEFAERLWTQYHLHADATFLTEIRQDFHARFWEMYLTCTLLEHGQQHGYSVSCPKRKKAGGPDILVERNGLRIWIEAVTATDGHPKKADSVIKPELVGKGHPIPDEKIILRYTNAIHEKHKKYLAYRSKNIVAADDAYVIAVNGFPLSYRWADAEMPRVLKAVFPIGPLEVVFDRKTAKVEAVRHQFRPLIHKSTGEKVSTEFFVNDQYIGISAILHSYANACITKLPFPEELVDQKNADQLGNDFLVVHNPQALQCIPRGLMPAPREYWATPVNDGYELVCHDTTESNKNAAGYSTSDILEERRNRRRQASRSTRAENVGRRGSSNRHETK